MSDNSIAFAGMDRADEEEIRSIYERANASTGGVFQAGSEDTARVLVVDVDSIHGHMTWLRVHNDPDRIVVAISARQTPHADHCLVRPVTVDAFADVLTGISSGQPAGAGAAEAASPEAPEEAAPPGGHEAVSGFESGPAWETGVDSPPEPGLASTQDPQPPSEDSAQRGSQLDPAPEAIPVAAQAPARRRLGDYLVPGALPGPSRLAFADAPELVVDPGARAYIGPAQLKGFAPYAQAGEITPEQWQAVAADEVSALANRHGTPQPWGRLAWLSGLYCSPGQLAPGHSLEDRFALLKWPQIEREFPRHFRIATAMMKAPATAAEIAEASATPIAEVIDFINASLAAGQAERVAEETPPEEAPAKAGGLLGRLKGLRGN